MRTATERQRDNRRRHKEAKERAAAERRQREEQEAVEAKKRAAKKKRENRKAKGLAKKAGDGPAVTQEEAVFSTTAPVVAATRSSDGDTTDEYDVDAAASVNFILATLGPTQAPSRYTRRVPALHGNEEAQKQGNGTGHFPK